MVLLKTVGQQAIVLDQRTDSQWSLVRRDIDTGHEFSRWNIPLGFVPAIYPWEDGRHVLLVRIGGDGWLSRYAKRHRRAPGSDLDFFSDSWECIVFDALAEREVARVRPATFDYVCLSPDGQTLVFMNRSGELEFWDVPSHKSLKWSVMAFGTWTSLVAWLACCRVRRLPPAVAETTLDLDFAPVP
jgi:hypothetical protein